MVGPMFGDALRRLRLEQGLSLRQLAARLNYSPAYLSEIERGIKPASIELASRCDQVLDSDTYLTNLAQSDRRQPKPAASPPAEYTSSASPTDVVMAAAHESTDRAAADGAYSVSEATIEQLHADVQRLAQTYDETSPMDCLLEARRVRDLAAGLSERTRRPTQVADLYLTVGQACALMSATSFDLAVWPAAVEQARSAYLYGELIDHRPLQAWARGFQALIASWTGRPREAVNLFERGLDVTPDGSARIRLLSIGSRAWAHLGDVERTTELLAAAQRERDTAGENGDDELHDAIGGQFGWSRARQAMSTSSSYLRIDRPREAAQHAREAMQLSPSSDHYRANAATDLACAELQLGHLDAAEAALTQIWDVPTDLRRYGLIGRLSTVVQLLTGDPYRSTSSAGDLRDAIESFVGSPSLRALPSAGLV